MTQAFLELQPLHEHLESKKSDNYRKHKFDNFSQLGEI